MKKIVILILTLFIAQLMHGQTILLQDFSGTAWPPEGWSIIGQSGNWLRSGSNHAGGIAPEARFRWVPAFTGNSGMVSPSMDLTGIDYVQIKFKHNVDFNTGNFTIGLSTRSGGASGAWNNVWTQTVTSHVQAGEIVLMISNDDVGSPDFQIGLFFEGNSANINSWYIDDVEVLQFNPTNLDAALIEIDVPDLVIGQHEVAGKVMNYGVTTINSLEISWQLDQGTVHFTSFTDLNLTTSMVYDFISDQTINVDPGNYIIKVWVSGVNGQAGDDNPDNDMLQKNISVLDQPIQRVPLFEEFTSSTCPPCATFNNSVMNPFFNQYQHDITLIKYQMNWPGIGDPYYTAEGGVRRSYYGINSVPSMWIEGANVATNWGAVYNAYQTAMNEQAFVDISSQHIIDGDNITVNTLIKPYINASNVRVHIVVIEQTTYGNVGTNGETSFKHVMMKMLPNANGTTANLAVGSHFVLNYSHDMSTTFVEDIDDLKVVVFIQGADKSIFQSAYSEEVTSFILPGDANCDGLVHVLDLIVSVNFILNYNPEPFCFENADVNSDGIINVLDVVATVNIILGGKKSANIPIRSLPASLFLHSSGIVLQSDGTLAGLQFEIEGLISDNLSFALNGYEFAFVEKDNKLLGLIFSFDNTPIPAGEIEIIKFADELRELKWGEVVAANLNANEVEVRKFINDQIVLDEGYEIKAYPNPSYGSFVVEIGLPSTSETSIKLFNPMGKEISVLQDGTLSSGNHLFRLNEHAKLPSGIYFLQLYSMPIDPATHVINKVIKVVISE